MFDSLHNVILIRPRIVIESLLEHFIFINLLVGGGPSNPPQGEVYNFEPPIYKSYIHPCYDFVIIIVYKYEFDKSMLMCAIIIIKKS